MPPGGGVPPYDPKTQWRVYREQQKAAWRAQRDAWKTQQHVWKASYVGAYGPRVPSVVGPVILIGVGIVALLVVTGHINAGDFWTWYGRWWPLLLIGAGLALLGEWALDMRRETPIRRGGSFIGILFLLAVLGLGDQGDNFFNAFGLPEHTNDQVALSSQIPANATIEIQNPRGDVSVTAGDQSSIQVQAHEVAFARSDEEANKIFEAEKPRLTVSGSAVLVKSDSSNSGRLNLTVTVPRTAKVIVNSAHGDVTAAGLGNGINITAAHGDIHLGTLTGQVNAHFSDHKGDFSAHQVEGDIIADGHCNDITLSEIKGKVSINGEIFGDVHMESVSGPINVHTSVTDLQVASLPGDLTLNPDDLRVTEAKGQVRITTHSKDVDLNQIYGDSYVENRNGRIAIEPAGIYSVEAKNGKGDVEVSLPPNASATVDGRTRNGDIVSEFALAISGEESKTISGRIGSGGSRITLNAQNGDLRIKKGSAFPPAPPAPNAAAAPTAPNAPHLKAHKVLPPQPITQ
jgi:DUF4097 and DUF4098 domain-containing protein YvlB